MDAFRLRPLSVGEVLDAGIKIYRDRFGSLWRAAAVVVVPVSILTTIVQLSGPSLEEDFGPDGQPTGNINGGDFAGWMATFLLVAVLGWIAGQLATAACFDAVGAAYLGQEKTWQQSLATARRQLRSLIWLQILFGLVIIAGFICFIIPGIHLYAALAVATPVLLFEGVKGKAALGRSRALVRGRWWPTAAVLLVVSVLSFLVAAALGSVLGGLVLSGAGDTTQTVLGGVLDTIATVLTTPFAAAVTTVLYFDALVRKEGFDLVQLAQGIGVDPGAPPPSGPFPPAGPYSQAPPPPPPPPGDYWPPPDPSSRQ